jgi:glycosyltransferase involved in cell wall biosynthesis
LLVFDLIMKGRETILHVIDSLGRGGAETLLVGYVKELTAYNHVLVYLTGDNEFENDLQGIKVIKLDFANKLLLPFYSLKLFKIIRDNCVGIIHSHLYWSTIVARLANLGQLPHYFSIHSKINEAIFSKYPYTKIIEAVTYNKNQIGIAVSGAVKEDYIAAMKPKGEVRVLYNYVEDKFYKNKMPISFRPVKNALKLVAVGNLKEQKNYPFLIKAFSLLKERPVSLDIYGSGPLYNELQSLIDKFQVSASVTLKGSVSNLENILPFYDAFVMASTVEGFGLAPIEAMAMGLPLLLSDINVLREVASQYAFYFNPYDVIDFVKLINTIINHEVEVDMHVFEGMEYTEAFAKKKYLRELSYLYNKALKNA